MKGIFVFLLAFIIGVGGTAFLASCHAGEHTNTITYGDVSDEIMDASNEKKCLEIVEDKADLVDGNMIDETYEDLQATCMDQAY